MTRKGFLGVSITVLFILAFGGMPQTSAPIKLARHPDYHAGKIAFSYLGDIWQQASRLHDQKVPAAEAARRIDMTAHKSHYPTITAAGVAPIGVVRMYDVMERRADQN